MSILGNLGKLGEVIGNIRGGAGHKTETIPPRIPSVPDTREELDSVKRQIEDARREAEAARNAALLSIRTRMMIHGANGVPYHAG